MKKICIIYNPKATMVNNDVLESLRENLECQNMDVLFLPSQYVGHVQHLIKIINKQADLIITLGGDGTLGEAFKGFNEVEQKAFYTHIAMGTANDTADNFGFDKVSALNNIELLSNIDRFNLQSVDMMMLNNEPFGYVSAFGTFASLSYKTPSFLKKTFGKTGYYVFTGLTALAEVPNLVHKPLDLTYECNGKIVNTKALTVIVSNTKTFAGFKLYPKADITDGLFEVTVLKSIPYKQLTGILGDFFGSEAKGFDINNYPLNIDTFKTDHFNLKVHGKNGFQHFNNDGDDFTLYMNDDEELEYKTMKKVKMLLPKK